MTDFSHYDPNDVLEPDDIIIPDKQEEARQHRFDELSALGKIQLPWTLRVLTAIGGLLLLFWGAASLITWGIAALADVVCMGKVRVFHVWRQRLWWCAKHALGIGLGVTIATINPPLGFGIVILYIAYQEGDDLKEGKFFQSVREYLKQYEKSEE